jgi:carbon monoxide dehydrogenase subunit G
MQLTHRFTLPAPVEQAWTAFYFPNRIAPCFPGATLNRAVGDEFDGLLKIKLGPVPVQYEGSATFLERSAEDQRIVVEAQGKDRRGHGTITATISMTFTGTESGTDVEVISAVDLSGQGSSFGQTVVQEAGDRLVQRLVDCVSGKFASGLGDLPTAEELATATPAVQAMEPEEASGDLAMEPNEASGMAAPEPESSPVAAESEGAGRVAAPELEETSGVVAPAPEEPQEAIGRDRVSAANVTAERGAVDADTPPASDTDHATAANEPSGGPTPYASAALSTTARPRGSALATVVLPRVRRFGPPVLGVLVVGSLISGIVRRLRR